MKYVISENRLIELITKYLNNWIEDKFVKKIVGGILVAEYEGEGSKLELVYISKNSLLKIKEGLRSNLQNLFGLTSNQVEDIVTDWFKNKFGVRIEYVS